METQHKDTYASFIGHPNLAKYVAVATGECTARTKLRLLEVRPCWHAVCNAQSMLIPLVKQETAEPVFEPSFERAVVESAAVDGTAAAAHNAAPHANTPESEEDMAID